MKNHFYPLQLKSLRINDTEFAVVRILEELSTFDLVAHNLVKSSQRLLAAREQLELSMKRNPSKRLTKEVDDAVKRCSIKLNAFTNFIHSFESDDNDAIKENAKKIMEHIDAIDWSKNRRNAANMSTEVKKLISVVNQQPDLTEAITALNATNHFDALNNSVQQLDIKIKTRSDVSSQNPETTASAAADEVQKAIKAFFDFVNVMLDQETNAELEALVVKINTVLIELNNSIKLRGSNKVDGDETDSGKSLEAGK